MYFSLIFFTLIVSLTYLHLKRKKYPLKLNSHLNKMAKKKKKFEAKKRGRGGDFRRSLSRDSRSQPPLFFILYLISY